MRKEIVVSVDSDETRAAVLEDGQLVEMAIERPVHQRVVGNIYKGQVENVLPGMQAAFVNIGLERNSFLYVDDAVPTGDADEPELPAKPTIGDVVQPGQEILVQVAKEAIGTKGARVTRHITLPGRFVVLMPSMDYVGVSRRISDEKERERLKSLAASVQPAGMGLIVRTVAEGAQAEDLARDVAFLERLWQRITRAAAAVRAPALVHRDLPLVARVVRDWLDDSVAAVWIDAPHEYERAVDLLELSSGHLKQRVHLFSDPAHDLFERHGVDQELDRALKKRVWLKSGGYIVIDQLEALTAIDVNTGKYVGSTNLADTVFKTNLEAAAEIARQLRLRDIGGIIIIDFIDMDPPDHRTQVIEALQEALRRDRTKTTVLGLTQLGLVEMTRKKSRESLDAVLTRPCRVCDGRGKVLSEETMARRVRAEIRRILKNSESEALLIEVNPGVAALLIGVGGTQLKALEEELGKTIFVRGNNEIAVEHWHLCSLGSRAEVEARALPVQVGEVLSLHVDETHVSNPIDGIARVDGYVIDIEGAGSLVGRRVQVEVVRTFRTYAKARVVT